MKLVLKIALGIVLAIVVLIVGCGMLLDAGTTTTDEKVQEVSEEKGEDITADWTMEQKNAFEAGYSYIDLMSFSKQGLIEQLSSEYGDNYPQDVAEFAVQALEDNDMVDWDVECEEAAQDYLDNMSFSKQELIEQLSSEYGDQFTVEQAERAVEKVYK